MTKGSITTTRSGRPRENPSPQAMAKEIQAVKNDVGDLKRILAPAFAPPMRESMSRGPGEYRQKPTVLRQASSNSDPWAGDIEHSESYMEAIRTGANIAELRQRSADDAVQRAIAHQSSPVIWESPAFCGQCRPATPCANCRGQSRVVRDEGAFLVPPQQSSIVHREWTDFPDHRPLPGAEPGYVTARQPPCRPASLSLARS